MTYEYPKRILITDLKYEILEHKGGEEYHLNVWSKESISVDALGRNLSPMTMLDGVSREIVKPLKFQRHVNYSPEEVQILKGKGSWPPEGNNSVNVVNNYIGYEVGYGGDLYLPQELEYALRLLHGNPDEVKKLKSKLSSANMERDWLRSKEQEKEKELQKIKSLNFWGRIKFLFKKETK